MRRLTLKTNTFLSDFHRSNRGATAVIVGLSIPVIVGMSGFVIDVGHAMVVKQQLQASADAAALAGARQINCCANSTAVASATAYSAAPGQRNAISGLQAHMVAGYPQLKCFSSTGISCTGPDSANGIVVKQTATVQTWFAQILGVDSIPVTATATAAGVGGGAGAYDIDIIVDTTASMNNSDPNCGMTRIQCALAGLQLILNKLSPSADYVGVMAFPPLSNAAQQARDTHCPTSNPTTTAYKNDANGQATYQIVPQGHNYQTSTPGQLNTSSTLVVAAGGAGCSGIQAPGGYGTFYADAITQAQADLTNNGRAGVQKAIIILSDGDAHASSTNMTAAKYNNQCAQAVAAAHAAAAAGMKVFTVAYGAQLAGCTTDSGTSPCATMQNMASDPNYFYSDNASGCSSATHSLTNLIQMMGGLALSFTAPRLVPDNTT
jgi:Flp pilus assembly protein TadG